MKKEEEIIIEARNRLVQVVWTHKINEKQTDIYKSYGKWLNIIIIVLDAITAGGIIGVLNNDCFAVKMVVAIVSTFTLALNSLKAAFKLDELSNNYKKYANKFLNIRNKLQWLIVVYSSNNIKRLEFIKRFEDVEKELSQLYSDAPSTTDKAVKKAKEALLENGDNYVTKEELEKLVPSCIKK